jgi:hypothetical protein
MADNRDESKLGVATFRSDHIEDGMRTGAGGFWCQNDRKAEINTVDIGKPCEQSNRRPFAFSGGNISISKTFKRR